MSLNRVTLIGRMARDPELRTTNTGKNIVEFTLAVDKRIKPQDPNAPTADFFRCKAWNQQAEFLANYGGKGRLCAVDGRLDTRKYVDKDGNNREAIEIVADSVQLLDRNDQGGDGGDHRDNGDRGGNSRNGQGRSGGGYSRPSQDQAPAGYREASRSQGGAGSRPQGRSNVAGPDEYDPFQDK